MPEISYFDLIMGSPVNIPGACTVLPPTLEKLTKDKGTGLKRYGEFINLLSLTTTECIETFKLQENVQKMSDEQRSLYSNFVILCLYPQLRELLEKALSFFISETIVFDENRFLFVVCDDSKTATGVITRENYDAVRFVILRLCGIKTSDPTPMKFANEHAKELYELAEQGRKKLAKGKDQDGSSDIDNIASVISIFSQNYNLLNIKGLTVCQLYDQFSRLVIQTQLNVASVRWAAWGKEPWNSTMWKERIDIEQ